MWTNGKDPKVPHAHVFEKDGHKYITFHSFSSKNSIYETPKLTFWLMNTVLSSFIMPQYHNYEQLLLLTAMYNCDFTEWGFLCWVTIETQWTHWSDWYFGTYYLIYFTKDKQVLFLQLSYFSENFEYSRWPIRTFNPSLRISLPFALNLPCHCCTILPKAPFPQMQQWQGLSKVEESQVISRHTRDMPVKPPRSEGESQTTYIPTDFVSLREPVRKRYVASSPDA